MSVLFRNFKAENLTGVKILNKIVKLMTLVNLEHIRLLPEIYCEPLCYRSKKKSVTCPNTLAPSKIYQKILLYEFT